MALTKISTAMISQSAAAVDLNVDAGTFYVDTTNNRVGVGGKTDPDTPLHVVGTATATLFAGSGASLTSIPNSALVNSSITINSTAVSLGGSLTLTTANIAENTNLYYTDARADARIAAADTDDLSEGSSNLYYTDARVDARVSGGSLGNITTTGYIRGPSSFTIDPAAHGDDTGTVVIAGNLQVDGTTTTINSTTMTVDDKNITLASGSANAAAASGAGFTVDIGTGTNPAITYDGTNDEWDFNKPLNVTGTAAADAFTFDNYTLDSNKISTNQASGYNGDIFLDAAGDIILDAAGNDVILKDNGTTFGQLTNDSGNLVIYNSGSQMLKGLSTGPNAEFIGTVKIPKLGINASANSNYSLYALQNGSITHAAYLQVNGGTATGLEINASASSAYSGDVLYARQSSRNTGGNLARFANSDGDKFVVKTDGNVGIGTSSPASNLHIKIATAGTPASTVAAGTSAGIYLEDDQTPTDNYFVSKVHNPGNDTAIGGIKFAVSPDGGNYSWAGIKGLTSSSGNAGNLAFYTSAGNTSGDSSTERMRIDSSGDVGIGVVPATHARLTIGGTATSYSSSLVFDNNTAGGAEFFMLASDNTWSAGANKFLMGHGSPSSSAVDIAIDADGKVGIGTYSPAAPLHIQFSNNDGGVGGQLIKNTNTGTTSNYASLSTQAVNGTIQGTFGSAHYSTWGGAVTFAGSQTSHPFKILTGNAVRATFDTAGNVGIGTTAGDSPGLWYDANPGYLAISHWATPPTPAAMLHLSDNSNDLDVPQIRIEGRENAGDTKLDISVKDAAARFNLVEGPASDANNGFGQMIFKTNAVANAAYPARGGFLFSTPADANNLVITNTGNVGIGTDAPSDGDMSLGIPKVHVYGGTGTGSYALLQRFQNGSDADNTGASIVLNHSNDRGIIIEGGRSTGNRSHGAIKSIDNVGRVTDAFKILGGDGAGVNSISLFTGESTTTTERMTITSDGNVGIGTDTPEGKLHVEVLGSNATPPIKINRGLDGGRIQLQYSSNETGYGEIGQMYAGTGRTQIWIGANLNSFSTGHNSSPLQHDANYASWFSDWDSYRDRFTIGRIASGTTSRLMTINSSGKVGIGTDNPSRLLTVQSTGQTDLTIRSGDSAYSQLMFGDTSADNRGGVLYNNATDDMHFATEITDGSGIALTIDNQQFVGIGTTSPGLKLEVDSGISSDIVKFGNNSGGFVLGKTANLGSMDLAADAAFRFRHGSVESLRLTPTESVFNEGSANVDFRVESNDSTNMFMVDGSSNTVEIGATGGYISSHLAIQNPRDRHHFTMTSSPNSAISATGGAMYAEGVVSISNVSAGTVLSIPHTSQANLWRPTYVELMFVTGEYNKTSGKAGYAKVQYSMLTYLANLSTMDVGGNVASVTTSGMNLLINFTSGYSGGLNNHEGVQMHYKIMSRTPDYFQAWNATLN